MSKLVDWSDSDLPGVYRRNAKNTLDHRCIAVLADWLSDAERRRYGALFAGSEAMHKALSDTLEALSVAFPDGPGRFEAEKAFAKLADVMKSVERVLAAVEPSSGPMTVREIRNIVLRAVGRLDQLCDQADSESEAASESGPPYYKEPRDMQEALLKVADLLED